MTTITTEVSSDLLHGVADDPEARDRERQRLREDFLRIVLHFHEELQRAGLASTSRWDHVDVVIQEKGSGHLLVEAKTSPERNEPEDSRGHAVAGVTAAPSLSPDEAEGRYQALGRWKGPLAAKDVQRAASEFWRGSGVAGARWLVRRLRDEGQVEVMHAAASALAEIGEASLGPIFEELSGNPPVDQAQVLLWALVSLAESEPSLRAEGARPELVLAEFLQHDEPDLRESAAGAMRLLRQERALRWLTHRLRDEANAEVRRTIEGELAWHRAGRS